jgi:hypothetical protein
MKYYFYKIQDNNNLEQFYIGSTVNLSRRKSQHKKNVRNKVGKLYWCKLYLYIRTHGGWDNFTFSKIHSVDIDINTDCKKEEQAIINILKPTLNTNKSSLGGDCITSYLNNE